MKTKNLTINVGVRKFNAVYQTKEFEAIAKVGRMVNANCIAMEAAHNVLGGKGQDLAGKEVKSIIIMGRELLLGSVVFGPGCRNVNLCGGLGSIGQNGHLIIVDLDKSAGDGDLVGCAVCGVGKNARF